MSPNAQTAIDLDQVNISWAPQPGSQEHFMSCPAFEVLYHGTRGPGKTDALIMDFAQHVGVGFGRSWRGILFRHSFPELAEVVIKTKKFFFEIFPGAKFNESSYTWYFPDGEQLLLRYADSPTDYWKYHGHEYPWIGWEELTTWATPDLYEDMKSCCRSSDPNVPRKYRSTANPYGVGHNWVKEHWQLITTLPGAVVFDKLTGRSRTHIKGWIHENQILMKADPEYWNLILGTKDPEKRKAWVYGDWNITAGGIFDDLWSRPHHVLDPFPIPAAWKLDRAFDDGEARPWACGFFAESDGSEVDVGGGEIKFFPDGSVIMIDELYGWNGEADKGNRQLPSSIAKDIKDQVTILKSYITGNRSILPGPADNSIFDAARGHAVSDGMSREGITWKRCDKKPGSRIAGVKLFREMLDATKNDSKDRPHFYIFSHCHHFLRTVPVLLRDKRKIDDVNSEQEDHIWDMLRYRIMDPEVATQEVGVTGI